MIDHKTLDRLASQLCAMAGGDWNKKRTKKNLWRDRIRKLLAMVEALP